jgi:hypothetical protein
LANTEQSISARMVMMIDPDHSYLRDKSEKKAGGK